MKCSVQYSLLTGQCAVCSVQCAVCSVKCAMCSVQCLHSDHPGFPRPKVSGKAGHKVIVCRGGFTVECVLYSVQCAVCSVQCAVCIMQCVVCSL